MKTLRFITAGNVDDGKSTLIGRLLYDSGSIYTDQLGILERQSKTADAAIDLSLVTDGLRAEREQGITIDVAYKYFSTQRRKFIIADAPGHEQYTRNMITGASNSDVIVILVDARTGITEQTRRHASIASLIGIRKAVVAINKIDLVDYSYHVFERISQDFKDLSGQLNLDEIHYIPVSALVGDNIVRKSLFTGWYTGKPLLRILEEIEVSSTDNLSSRFQVQWVIRPKNGGNHDYRGYAGPMLSGSYTVGDPVRILPSDTETVIVKIEKDGESVFTAHAGDNIVLHFKNAIDISRGDTIVKSNDSLESSSEIKTWVSWLSQEPLNLSKTYILQHRFRNVRAKITAIESRWDVNNLKLSDAEAVGLNDIALVSLKVNQPVHYDGFTENPKTGSAILVDETTYSTVAGLMFVKN